MKTAARWLFDVKAPVNGRIHQARVDLLDRKTREVKTTDKADLESMPERLKLCKRLAERLGVDVKVVAAAVEAGWVTAVQKQREEHEAREAPSAGDGSRYRVEGGAICRVQYVEKEEVLVQLANFNARITDVVSRDDGAECTTVFGIEGALQDGTRLPRAAVTAAAFPGLNWVTDVWNGRAVVYAGMGTRDHLRCAIELLSTERPRRVEYLHTGWREIAGRWLYLHAGGAVAVDGVDGVDGQVEVSLPDALAQYRLPEPFESDDLRAALRTSLAILDVAPDVVTVAALGAVWRSVLGPADFSLHLCGPTGVGKTELAALLQQHFGADMDARHLPGSWASTGNSLEVLAFAAKDAVLTVDDFAPSGSSADVQRYHKEADRLLRGQGNRSGRQRLRPDGTLRPARAPRGLVISTGEDIPRGQSLRARALALELSPGQIDWGRLTDCQRDAAAGLYAGGLAGYLRWLAPRYPSIRDGLRAEVAGLREQVHGAGEQLHRRVPVLIADLAAGWRHWLEFAYQAGAIPAAEGASLKRRVWSALLKAAAAQAEYAEAAEPCAVFLRLLAGALASGRAHVVGRDGGEPASPGGWGWRQVEVTAGQSCHREWRPQGRCVGWLDGTDLYLEPAAAFAEAQELARQQGECLPVSGRTLGKRLQEKRLLASWDEPRQRNTVRRDLGGVRHREVLHLRGDVLSRTEPSTPSTNDEKLCPETG